MEIYLILGAGILIVGLYALWQRSQRLREEDKRIQAEAAVRAVVDAQEALFKAETKNKAEIQDAVNKAKKGDYSSLFTIS